MERAISTQHELQLARRMSRLGTETAFEVLNKATSEGNFVVVDTAKGKVGETRLREEVIAEVDFTGAHTTLYEGAVYLCESEI